MTRIKRFLISSVAFIAFAFSLVACGYQSLGDGNSPQSSQSEITISAAASLQEAFRELGTRYEEKHKVKINFNFASSGVLQNQIQAGAPVDVFASASKQQMDQLAERNLILQETRRDFAKNELILIVSAASATEQLSFSKFLQNDQSKIAIGNPKTVPAGIYAEQTLRRLGVWQKAEPRLIFGEDVRQVLEYVARGEVEYGVVYASDVRAAQGKVREAARAPENSHDPILYQIAVLKNSQNQVSSSAFIELVLSQEGQATLQKYGFMTVNG